MSPKKTSNQSEKKSAAAENVHDKTDAVAEQIGGVGNVDKIREILFGSQMRDYERIFSRLEQQMAKEISDVRQESENRFGSLETYIKSELEALNRSVKNEKDEREESIQEVLTELKNSGAALEKRLKKIDERLEESSKELRQQILDQSKNLSEDIRKKNHDTTEELKQTAGELRDEKVNRDVLSELLAEIAMRISGNKTLDFTVGLDEKG